MDIKIDDDEINVKEIMEKIKKNIHDKKIPRKDFNDYNAKYSTEISNVESELVGMNRKWYYSADIPLVSHRNKLIGKLILISKKVIRKSLRWHINPIVNNQIEFNASTVRVLNEMSSLLSKQELEKGNSLLQLKKQQEHIENLEMKINHIEYRQNESIIESNDFDYLEFENKYRGTRESIKEKQKQYLKYFNEGDTVLDLGCGRGEFSELLIENKIQAISVDSNNQMIDYCGEIGIRAIKSDIFDFLDQQNDASCHGIFLGQVIEHLTLKQLLRLLELSKKKLMPNGIFIAETPNPQCLSIYAQSFYLDPTHVKPVHPFLMRFIMESRSFSDIEIHYFSKNDGSLHLPVLLNFDEVQIDRLNEFNEKIQRWNDVIFGNQDYYIMGIKREGK
ncbi:class I SAM-dependent methyltransferase [Paenibacillus sp. D51F]